MIYSNNFVALSKYPAAHAPCIFYITHFKNRLLTVKRFLLLLKDFLFKIVMRGNSLTVKGLSFQMLSFYCQNISFVLEMKSFVVQREYIFKDKRKQIVWYNLWEMYTSPTLTNANIKSIIINTIITIRLRFQLKEMSRYNFKETHNIQWNSRKLYKII